jgi:hypothetical protein
MNAQLDTPLMSANEDASREIAAQLEREHPNWIIIFGVYTKQFIAFPRFGAPRRTILTALYPQALAERIARAEIQANISQPRKEEDS